VTAVAEVPSQIGQYVFIEEIGAGAFAVVYKAQDMLTMVYVAIKVISKRNIRSKFEFDLLQREVNLIRTMDHPFIALFYEAIEDEKNFYLVQELVENGNLLEYVNKHKGLSEDEAAQIFIQLVSVLDYIHNTRHVAHRDLKAENVLLDRNNNIRLCDFGLSRAFTRDDPYLKTTCGSPAYVAPEVIREQPYTTSADIWSAGILLYAMVVGRLPFNADNISFLLQQIMTANPPIPISISQDLHDLINKILVKDPRARITITEIEEHPWLQAQPQSRIFKDPQFEKFFIRRECLDVNIISEMRILGFDTQTLTEEINDNEINRRTAVYKMLKREICIDQFNKPTPASISSASSMPLPTAAFLPGSESSAVFATKEEGEKLPPLHTQPGKSKRLSKPNKVLSNPSCYRKPMEGKTMKPGFQTRMRKRNSNLSPHPN
jgi:serine/threonine protein kinase